MRALATQEAAAKTMGLHLLEAIREVGVVRVVEEERVVRYQGEDYPVRHGEGDAKGSPALRPRAS